MRDAVALLAQGFFYWFPAVMAAFVSSSTCTSFVLRARTPAVDLIPHLHFDGASAPSFDAACTGDNVVLSCPFSSSVRQFLAGLTCISIVSGWWRRLRSQDLRWTGLGVYFSLFHLEFSVAPISHDVQYFKDRTCLRTFLCESDSFNCLACEQRQPTDYLQRNAGCRPVGRRCRC